MESVAHFPYSRYRTGITAMTSAGISTFAKRLFGAIMRRIPAGSRIKRELLEVALLQLEEAAYMRLRDQGFSPKGIKDECTPLMGAWFPISSRRL